MFLYIMSGKRGGGGGHINASNAGASAASSSSSAASSSSSAASSSSSAAFKHDDLLSLSLNFCSELSKKTNAHACFTLYHSNEYQYLCKSYKLNKAMHDGRKDFCSSRGDSIFFKEYETFMKNQGVTVNKYEKAVVSMSDSIEKILNDSSSPITCALAFIADDPYAKVTESSLTQMGVTFDKTKSCVLPDHGMSHRTLKLVCGKDVEIEQNWSMCYDGGKTMRLEYCPCEVAGMCFVLGTQVCIILTTPVKNNGIVHVDGVACVFNKQTNSFMKNIKFTTNKSLITENVKYLLPGVDWLVNHGKSTFGGSIALCFLAKLWADTSLYVSTEFYNKNNKNLIDAGTKKEIVVATHDVGSAENSMNMNPYVCLVNNTEHHLLPACMLIAHTTSVNAVVGQTLSNYNRPGILFCQIKYKPNITHEERTENLRKWQINQEYFKKIEYSEERLTLLKNLESSLIDMKSEIHIKDLITPRASERYREKLIEIGNVFSTVKKSDSRPVSLILAHLMKYLKKNIKSEIKLLSSLQKDKNIKLGKGVGGGGGVETMVDSYDESDVYSNEPSRERHERNYKEFDPNSDSYVEHTSMSNEEIQDVQSMIDAVNDMHDDPRSYISSKFITPINSNSGNGGGGGGGGGGTLRKKGGNPPRKTRKPQKTRKHRKTYRK